MKPGSSSRAISATRSNSRLFPASKDRCKLFWWQPELEQRGVSGRPAPSGHRFQLRLRQPVRLPGARGNRVLRRVQYPHIQDRFARGGARRIGRAQMDSYHMGSGERGAGSRESFTTSKLLTNWEAFQKTKSNSPQRRIGNKEPAIHRLKIRFGRSPVHFSSVSPLQKVLPGCAPAPSILRFFAWFQGGPWGHDGLR